MNPLAIACAIFPPPMKPILCILKFSGANGEVLNFRLAKYGEKNKNHRLSRLWTYTKHKRVHYVRNCTRINSLKLKMTGLN